MGISTLRRHHEARAATQRPAAPPAVVPYDQARQMVRDAVRPLQERIAELQTGGDLGAAQAKLAKLEAKNAELEASLAETSAKLAELEAKNAEEPSGDEAIEPAELEAKNAEEPSGDEAIEPAEPAEPTAGDPAAEPAQPERGKRGRR